MRRLEQKTMETSKTDITDTIDIVGRIVVPGEIISDSGVAGRGVYLDNNRLKAKLLGIISKTGKTINITPLRGRYLPKRGDLVIGKVFDITLNGWRVDINSPYTALISTKEYPRMIRRGEDLSRYLAIDDYVISIVSNVTSQNIVDLSMKDVKCKKLESGLVFKINPFKVSRVIGTKGSMINLIKQKTDCKILLGTNGIVWVQGKGKQQLKAMNSIKIIERLAHTKGLTDRITRFLEANNN